MQNDVMNYQEALNALEALLGEFALRSGGGDGKVISDSVKALKHLKEKADVHTELRRLEEKAIKTGSVEPILRIFEVLKFELLILSLEGIEYFAPGGSDARLLAKQVLPHLYKVREILEPHYMQEFDSEQEQEVK